MERKNGGKVTRGFYAGSTHSFFVEVVPELRTEKYGLE
jgi:hypothetical protein